MIQSMTGFGSASFAADSVAFELDVRSVNHRHLDVRVRLPRALAALEIDFRARIQERFGRGKFDCRVATPEGATPAPRLEIDLAAAREYLSAARELTREEAVGGELGVADLLALPGVARLAEPDFSGDALHGAAGAALDAALGELAAMRAAEGEVLARDLLARLDRVGELAGELEQRSGDVRESVRERLRKRARQLEADTGMLDEARLHQEIVIAADRLDITEEVVRLRSHIDQFRALLAMGAPGSPVGRRLEFLLQELGREANTIGSKGSDAPIAHAVVELKAELERLREQVQNVE
ncbi:MAG TPA: YicC/YloC family endoribonuclease [Myxococcota bacterium]